MLVQYYVHYNMLSKKITLWGDATIVKDLTFQCGGEEFKSPHLHLGYLCHLGYLGDLIK
jgi:hypothetical protein